MNLTARERLLMSLTAKQVEKWIDENKAQLIYLEQTPINGKETDVIELPLWGEIRLNIHDLNELHEDLKDRDQRIINENNNQNNLNK